MFVADFHVGLDLRIGWRAPTLDPIQGQGPALLLLLLPVTDDYSLLSTRIATSSGLMSRTGSELFSTHVQPVKSSDYL